MSAGVSVCQIHLKKPFPIANKLRYGAIHLFPSSSKGLIPHQDQHDAAGHRA